METPRRSITFSPPAAPSGRGNEDAGTAPARAHAPSPEPTRRPRGRPRLAGVDERVLAAARALTIELGYEATSIEAIAERSGVARTAIYRRWPNKGILLYEAVLAADDSASEIPDTGDLRADLLAILRVNSEGIRSSSTRGLVAALVAEAMTDDRLASLLRTRYFAPRADAIAARAERAITRGEIGATLDAGMVPVLLTGSLQYLWLVRGSRLDEADLARVVDAILGPHRPNAPGTERLEPR